jgi:predicted nucleic acid-binding Zn ribbon protein
VGIKKADSYDNRLLSIIFVCKRLQTLQKKAKSCNFMAKTIEKTCLECGDKIKGRADKKFCSDQCRISYNNKLNSDETNYVRNVNNILRKNRRILMDLNTTGKTRVSRDKLNEKGFDYSYYTSTYTTKEGAQYKYCYEQGYLEMDKNYFLLVVKKEL